MKRFWAIGCVVLVALGVWFWQKFHGEPLDPIRTTTVRSEDSPAHNARHTMRPVASSTRDLSQDRVVPDKMTQEPTRSPPESQAPASLPVDAKVAEAADARFRIRWGKAGLCSDEDGPRRVGNRGSLIQGFKTAKIRELQIAFDDSVREEVLQEVASTIQRTRQYANYLLGWSPQSSPPRVVVYRDLEQMLSVACANKATLGYYDGEIHLSGSWTHGLVQIRQSAAHEYVHHVLNTMGVSKPMWFHEGLAMRIAEEEWWRDPKLGLQQWLEKEHLPFQALIEGFPHTADELFAGAAYYQSLMMVSFIRERRGPDSFRQLLNDLSAGIVSPSRAFSVATGLEGAQLEAAWNDFVKEWQEKNL